MSAVETKRAQNGASSEVIDSTAVELVAAQPGTLFRTDDPVEVLEKATAVANALASVIEQRGLYVRIGAKKHIIVEGWQTLGAMLGVTPVCTWSRLTSEPAKGWEARVEARTLDGRTIGAAEAECLRSEKWWQDAEDYAVRSMAQTRACSKALASVLRFVVTLAGFEGTPAEEMPNGNGSQTPPVSVAAPKTTVEQTPRSAKPASPKQKAAIKARLAAGGLEEQATETKAILNWIGGSYQLDRLSSEAASNVIRKLGQAGDGAKDILADLDTNAEQGVARAVKIRDMYFGKDAR